MDFDIRGVDEARSVLLTPAGGAFEVEVSTMEFHRFLKQWVASGEDQRLALDPELQDFGTMLESEGVLDSRSQPQVSPASWVVVGDGALGAELTKYLAHQGVRSTLVLPGEMVETDLRAGIVVAAFDRFMPDALRATQAAAFARMQPFSYLYASANRFLAGPHMMPGCTPDLSDVFGRMAMCSPLGTDIVSEAVGPSPREVLPTDRWAVATFVADVQAWLAGRPSVGSFGMMELTAEPLAVHRHPVLPLPSSSIDLATARAELERSCTRFDLGATVDRNVGMVIYVREVEHDPSGPQGLVTHQALAGDLGAIYPWRNSRICGGSTFWDPDASRDAAVAEAIERYCLNYVDRDALQHASYEDLVEDGQRVVHPDEWVLFSDEQYAAPSFPFRKLTEDTEISWVEAVSVTDRQAPVLVPAGLVYGNFYVGPLRREAHFAYHAFAGIAAGRTRDEAIFGGLREVVERDATMIWWLNGGRLPRVDFSRADPDLWAWCEGTTANRAWVLRLPNIVDMPVMCAVVVNSREELLNVGFGAHPDAMVAIRKAISEAFILQEGSRDMLLCADSLFQKAAERGMMIDYWFKPWSADRDYLSQFAPDFSDVGDLMVQQQLYLDPGAQLLALEILEADGSVPFDDLANLWDVPITTEAVIARLATRGFEVIAADLTTVDAALAGVSVIRMLVPGLVPNTPAGFPALGKGRVERQGRAWGLAPSGQSQWRPNRVPLPHA